jgi:phosphoribosyl 1,2-cyclic phosphodiesterase
MKVISCTFPYLVNTKSATGSGEVARLDFSSTLQWYTPCTIAGIDFIPIPLEHGKFPDGSPFYCNGFIIDRRIVYMSDVSRVSEEVYEYIRKKVVGRIKVLILDCLFRDRDMQSHIGWPGAKRVIEELKPERTFLVGMDHCIEHDEFGVRVFEEMKGVSHVALSYDGLEVEL